METILLILAGLLAVGFLVRQSAAAARGKGCSSCTESRSCSSQKFDQEQQFSQRCK